MSAPDWAWQVAAGSCCVMPWIAFAAGAAFLFWAGRPWR